MITRLPFVGPALKKVRRNALTVVLSSVFGGLLAFALYDTTDDHFVVASLSLLTGLIGIQIGLLSLQLSQKRSVKKSKKRSRPARDLLELQQDRYISLLKGLEEEFRGTRPIIVGPWVTEIGFELLYWIPLLRKLFSDLGIPPSRVIALSRGGCRQWYSDIAGSYVEIFDLVGSHGFAAGMAEVEAERGGKKLIETTQFEHDLVASAARARGLDDYGVIFSGMLYDLFRVTWAIRAPACAFAPYLDIQPLDPSKFPLPPGFDVGPDYFTAKFYYSNCLTDTPEVRHFIRDKLLSLAEIAPVVLLSTGKKIDDHEDAKLPFHRNIVDATRFYQPLNNLAVQSALVAHSKALFSTYGGFSYLGPLLGVPTTSFYDHPNFVSSHFDVALRHLATPEAGLALMPITLEKRAAAERPADQDADLNLQSALSG